MLHTKKEKVVHIATTKIEKKAKKLAKRLKVLAIIIGVLLALAFMFVCFYEVSNWYDSHKVIFQSPIIIKLQSPIKIEKRKFDVVVPLKETKVIVTPTITQPDEFELAYDKVWLRESGRGTNKQGLNGYCISRGMVNEIGYDPQDNYCFADTKEQKETFMLWLNNRINKIKSPWCNNVDECLLVYSNGSYKLYE